MTNPLDKFVPFWSEWIKGYPISKRLHCNLYIYKRPEVFSFDASVCLNYWMYMDKWYLIRTGLMCRLFFFIENIHTYRNGVAREGNVILRASFALQLLILSTGTHFQHVSEHYIVTRTSLSILTLKRKVQQVPISTIVYSTAPTIVLQ